MMPQAVNSNQALYIWVRDFLETIYADKNIDNIYVKTLAMMITGMILGPHVQLFAIAMCVPLLIKLPSLVRRFERLVSDDQVEVEQYFEPFVRAMIISLGNETAYLLIDCTQAGRKCRTLFIGLAYHSTVLPLVWKTLKGKKGHVKGAFQKELLEQVYPRFQHCRRVIVLGDAEFSNEPVINGLKPKKWGFVLHFQSNYRIQLEPNGSWLSALSIYEAAGLQPGQVKHWPIAAFTELHQIPNLTMTVHWEAGYQEPLCLISNLNPAEQPHLLYEMRYWVETLFGNCKSRGFQLARTHMTTPAHLDRLILGLAIATCLALGLGTHLIVINQADQVDRADRRDLSLFQLGWRWLYRLLALDRLHELKIVFRWDFKLPPAGFQPAK
jgi:Transposase DDE domain